MQPEPNANVEGVQTPPAITPGGYKVGIMFNPGEHAKVNELKQKAADFIDAVNTIEVGQPGTEISDRQVAEVERLKALAITHCEDAAMWAVKAATKPA